jgi:RHS repeat-associated protein
VTRFAVGLFLWVSVFLTYAVSQVPPPTQDGFMGLTPYGSFNGGNIDSVNLSNGTLTVQAPFLSYPQRGKDLGLTFNVSFNGKPFQVREFCPPKINCFWVWLESQFGASVSVSDAENVGSSSQKVTVNPSIPTYGYIYSILLADNSSHIMGRLGGDILDGQDNTYDETGNFRTLDATGWEMVLPSITTPSYISPSGVRYSFPSNGVQKREDANGNYITLSSNYTSYTDTLGRQIPAPPTVGSSGNTNSSGCTGPLPIAFAVAWTPPGHNGGNLNYKFCYVTVLANMAPLVNNGQHSGLTKNVTMLQSVVLPNSTSWTFEYNDPGDGSTYNGNPVNYGSLTKITLPTGGTISYTYVTGAAGTCDWGSRWVSTRSVDDGTGSHTWTYSWNTSAGNVVTDPFSNDSAHAFSTLVSGGYSCSLYETSTKYYQGNYTNGSVQKTVTTNYGTAAYSGLNNGPVNVAPTQIVTSWPNGQVKETDIGYDPGFTIGTLTFNGTNTGIYGKATSKSDYDYGASSHGALLRTTSTQYLALSNSNYLNNNLLNLPSQIQVSGNGAVALTTYGYDESSRTTSGITTQFDTSPPDKPYYGNQTSVNRWVNTSSSLKTSRAFFDTGTVNTVTDPKLNATTYSYSGTFAGAYVTETQLPTTTDAGGTHHQHIIYANYDLNTGLIVSHTDENSKVTTYGYDDMWRIKDITYPASDTTGTGGGSESYTYDDTPGQVSVQVQHTIDGTQSTNEYTLFDGLGREISGIKANGESTPYDRTDTCYDAVGRKSHASYPYQSSSMSSASCTSPSAGDTYTYDALSRVTQVSHSDGSTVLTSYGSPGGRAADVQDEGTGNPNSRVERVSQVDGLGRLVSVCEVTAKDQLGNGGQHLPSCGQDIAKPGFLTSYGYDGLGNLLTVTQGTLSTRTFAYDGLSRLLCAANPEIGGSVTCPNPDKGTYTNGTTRYGYDGDSNAISRIRPAPNQGSNSTTVTTTYQYDALNRLTQKSYSDGVTPTVMFGYDQSSITMGTQQFSIYNNSGRLSWSAPVNTSGYTIEMNAFTYDPMGRIAELWQANPVGNNNIWISYGYDFLGDETGRNLSGNTYAATYNVAGRLTSYKSTDYNDATNPANLLTGVQHDAFGHMTAGTLANGLSESWGYDPRGRVTAMAVGTKCANGNCSTNQYRFTTFYEPNSNVSSSTDTVNGSWTYSYDDFNRISTGVATNGEGCSYAYDRYGNRWQQNAYSGSCLAPQYSFTGNNNRIDGGSYDAIGNLLYDGSHHYVYDAENRIISVDSGATTYIYDAEDRRVAKNVGGSLKDFIYDREGRIILNNPATPSFIEMYVAGQHLGTYIINSAATDTIFYYDHGDWLGTERARTNLSGAVCEKITSLSFGDNQTITSNCVDATDVSPMHFTGKERDTESNLDYFGARYYSSAQGRFLTPDWASAPTDVPYAHFGDPQSLNLYGYVRNNPLASIDPDGHNEATWWSGLGANEAENEAAFDEQVALQKQAQNQSQDATTTGATTTTVATVATSPSTMEQIDQVVKPLVDSAEAATGKAGNFLLDVGADVLGTAAVVLTLSQKTADNAHDTIQPVPEAAHKTGERESTREKHEAGEARRSRDRGGEKGDARRRPPRKPPNGWKGPWPPKEGQNWW